MVDVHFISHTHWDREWYLTREQFRLRLVELIDRVIDRLTADARFKCFHLDGQTIVLEDYLEMRPEREAALRRLIADGRLLVGPWYDMPDEFLVSGEALVRNLALGHRLARRFGEPMMVGYLPDLFGHVAQMPQILARCGLDNAVLWRGFGGPKAEYWWEAPDGTRLLMLHLPPEGYCNAVRVALVRSEMIDRTRSVIARERARSAVGQVLLMNGVDHVEPHPNVMDLIDQLANGQVRIAHSTLPAYVRAVQRALESAEGKGGLEVIRGELRGGEDYAPLLPGVLSARTYLKQWNARVQNELERWAEPLSVFAMVATGSAAGPAGLAAAARDEREAAGRERQKTTRPTIDEATYPAIDTLTYPDGELRYAWKTLLQNHPHDSICGCSIDEVHTENETRFARAAQVADAVATRALTRLARSVGGGTRERLRAVVVNTDIAPYAGTVEAAIDLPYASAEPRRRIDAEALEEPVHFYAPDARVAAVLDPSGAPTSFQILDAEDVITQVMSRYETPWALRARRVHLVWMAEVPPCGYAAYDVMVAEGGGPRAEGGEQRTDGGGPRADGGGPRADASDVGPGFSRASGVVSGFSRTLSDRSADNDCLRLTINDDGTVDVLDKRSGTRYSRCGELEDVGDVGDEYTYSPPARDTRVTNAAAADVRIARRHAGPLRASFHIDLSLRVPAGATDDRAARSSATADLRVAYNVTLDAGSPLVKWDLIVTNAARDHRLRLLFPTGARDVDQARADSAFDVVRRPARKPIPDRVRVEAPVSAAPMTSFVDAGDDRSGATAVAHGLNEYEILEDASRHATIAVTLLRSVGDLSRDDLATRPGGHAGPPVRTPGAQCLGTHRFTLAMMPRAAEPDERALYAAARSVVSPPRVATSTTATGMLPATRSFYQLVDEADRLDAGALVLSACKRADERDGIVVRIFNPTSTPISRRLRTDRPIAAAYAVDFLERRTRPLRIAEHAIEVSVGPHRIETIELVS